MNRVYIIFCTIVAIFLFNKCGWSQNIVSEHEPGECVLFDFDSQSAFDGWTVRDLTHMRPVASPWEGHGQAMEVTIDPWSQGREGWPSCNYIKHIPWPANSYAYRLLTANIKNVGTTQAIFKLQIRDSNDARYNPTEAITLRPGEVYKLSADISTIQKRLNLTDLVQFHFYADYPPQGFTIVVDDVCVSPGVAQSCDRVSGRIGDAARWVNWNCPAGEIKNSLNARISRMTSEIASIRSDYRSIKTISDARILLEKLDIIEANTESFNNSLATQSGRDRAKAYIQKTGIADDWTLGLESSMAKVAYNAMPFVGTFGSQISLDGARGESVHSQIVIIPTKTSLSSVTFNSSALKGPNGKNISIMIRPVGFLKTQKPPYEVSYIGWWPDPLLDNLKSFSVPYGAQQPLYISIDIPRSVTAGIYTGKISVTPKGRKPQSITIYLRVRNFTIPIKRNLRIADVYAETVAEKIHAKAWNDTLKWKYRDFLLAHRLNVDSIYKTFDLMKESVADLKRLKAGGQNFVTVSTWDDVKGLKSRLKEAGLLDCIWCYGYDEFPVDRKAEVIDGSRTWREQWPEAKTMTTADPRLSDDPAVDALIDAWVPISPSIEVDSAIMHRIRSRGKEVWYYVCIGPSYPYANLQIEKPGIEQRLLLGYMIDKVNAGGFLYYALNLCGANTKPISDGPLCSWTPASFADYNGDGAVFYEGINGPVSTIRLENMRDGIEDYETNCILKSMLAQAASKTNWNDKQKKILDSAKKLSVVPDSIVRKLSDFTYDPNRLEQYRSSVNQAIENLIHLGLKQVVN